MSYPVQDGRCLLPSLTGERMMPMVVSYSTSNFDDDDIVLNKCNIKETNAKNGGSVFPNSRVNFLTVSSRTLRGPKVLVRVGVFCFRIRPFIVPLPS